MSHKAETPEEFWTKFDEELNNTYTFPTEYIFKFIVSTDIIKIETLKEIFSKSNPITTSRESSGGNYTSFTFTAILNNSAGIVHLYKKAAEIEGIKSL